MPNWTTPVLPADSIVRKNFWDSNIVDNLRVLNDIIGHPGAGHRSLTNGGVLLGQGTAALKDMGVLVKASILVGDGATEPTEVTVGNNDNVLQADSSKPAGVQWGPPSWDVAEAIMYGC